MKKQLYKWVCLRYRNLENILIKGEQEVTFEMNQFNLYIKNLFK